MFWVVLYGLKALVAFCSWCDRKGWSLGTWQADDVKVTKGWVGGKPVRVVTKGRTGGTSQDQ